MGDNTRAKVTGVTKITPEDDEVVTPPLSPPGDAHRMRLVTLIDLTLDTMGADVDFRMGTLVAAMCLTIQKHAVDRAHANGMIYEVDKSLDRGMDLLEKFGQLAPACRGPLN